MADGTLPTPGGWNRFSIEVDDLDAQVGAHADSSKCVTAGSTTGDCGALPSVSASPEAVVRAYIAALDRHDLALAKKLLEPGFRARVESEADGLSNIVSITDVRVVSVTSRHRSSVQSLPEGYHDEVTVTMRYDLRQRQVLSRSDGDTIWGYTLVRRGAGSRWLISGDGTG